MDKKNWLLGGVAGFVVMFTLSGLWYLLIMTDYYATHYSSIERETANFVFVMLGYFILALLMSYAYPLGYKEGTPSKEGLRFGVVIGLMIWLPVSLILHGVWRVPLIPGLVDTVYHVVEVGLGGLAIALVYGKKN